MISTLYIYSNSHCIIVQHIINAHLTNCHDLTCQTLLMTLWSFKITPFKYSENRNTKPFYFFVYCTCLINCIIYNFLITVTFTVFVMQIYIPITLYALLYAMNYDYKTCISVILALPAGNLWVPIPIHTP